MKLLSELFNIKKTLLIYSLTTLITDAILFIVSTTLNYNHLIIANSNSIALTIISIIVYLAINVVLSIICLKSKNLQYYFFGIIINVILGFLFFIFILFDYAINSFESNHNLKDFTECFVLILKALCLMSKAISSFFIYRLSKVMKVIDKRQNPSSFESEGHGLDNKYGSLITQSNQGNNSKSNISRRSYNSEEEDEVGSLAKRSGFNYNIVGEESYNSKVFSTPKQLEGSDPENLLNMKLSKRKHTIEEINT